MEKTVPLGFGFAFGRQHVHKLMPISITLILKWAFVA